MISNVRFLTICFVDPNEGSGSDASAHEWGVPEQRINLDIGKLPTWCFPILPPTQRIVLFHSMLPENLGQSRVFLSALFIAVPTRPRNLK
ncbi:hypothetical protein A3K79_01195 [Candidatus Bathyarchaeota archaeon RBG_13_46_16b]|nr:MAG: hypothetical protein A3K79_01195 [Candidatus Bathyarchaeota archaeon RBG_13_46_16b]